MSPVWKAAHSRGVLRPTGSLAKYLVLESSLKASGWSFYNKGPGFLTLSSWGYDHWSVFSSLSSWLFINGVSRFTFFFSFFCWCICLIPSSHNSHVLCREGTLVSVCRGRWFTCLPLTVCWLGKASEMTFCFGSLKAWRLPGLCNPCQVHWGRLLSPVTFVVLAVHLLRVVRCKVRMTSCRCPGSQGFPNLTTHQNHLANFKFVCFLGYYNERRSNKDGP